MLGLGPVIFASLKKFAKMEFEVWSRSLYTAVISLDRLFVLVFLAVEQVHYCPVMRAQ